MRGLFNLALIVTSVFPHTLWNVGFGGIISSLHVQAKETDFPTTTISYFEGLPTKFHYVKGSRNILYFDDFTGDVYFSEDDAKSWTPVDGVPRQDAYRLIEHPFDPQVAFILTRGTKHYKTHDGGRTWHKFEVPLPPSSREQSLSFHADPQKAGYMIYQGRRCEDPRRICQEEAFYTTDGFEGPPEVLLPSVTQCFFARSSTEFATIEHDNLIFCHYRSEGTDGMDYVLLSSSDFFTEDRQTVDFGVGPRGSRRIFNMMTVDKFLTVALLPEFWDPSRKMEIYVTTDSTNWKRAHFPHDSNPKFNDAYGVDIMETMSLSLVVDIPQSYMSRNLGTLFVSDSNGDYFVESLKNTYRSDTGTVDFKGMAGIQGIGLASQVANGREVGRYIEPKLKTLITYDHGSSWSPLEPPSHDMHNLPYQCHANATQDCSLHLHLTVEAHNPPTPPGFLLGVGSVSETLLPYEESDTYLSRDGGMTWMQVRHGPHKYAFGDNGNIVVLVDDEKPTDHVRYSVDSGSSWEKLRLGVNIRAVLLTSAPEVTSQQFMLIGALGHGDTHNDKRITVINLDFTPVQNRQCEDGELEKWYARGNGTDCILGEKRWFWRRKPEADCYIGTIDDNHKPGSERCLCTDADFGCDYNYVREGDKCISLRPEPIPAGACQGTSSNQTYEGPSGYRLNPGNTCKRTGVNKDAPIMKSCTEDKPEEGEVAHQTFKFPSMIGQYLYFQNSKTILVYLWDRTVWQSNNEGYTWQLLPYDELFRMQMHSYSDDRAYLFTTTHRYYYTIDRGHSWNVAEAPLSTTRYTPFSLVFHPTLPDSLIWTGDVDCDIYDGPDSGNCHTAAYLSSDHGRTWKLIETYVNRCEFSEALGFSPGDDGIVCASYRDKKGMQHGAYEWNPLELTIGHNWYTEKQKIFDHIIGFDTAESYLFVGAVAPGEFTLDLHVSHAGDEFVMAHLPPGIHLEIDEWRGLRAVVQSTQNVTFLQIGTSTHWRATWATMLKSDDNSTFYGSILEHVNESMGKIEYSPISGLDGVAVVNVLTNPNEAMFTGNKKIQTLITHSDGASWHSLRPPLRDSLGAVYPCDGPSCLLHLHSRNITRHYFEVTSDAPSIGAKLAVGNVGKFLSPYADSDMFITRNGGFTWEEIHKGTHVWAFGDSGSILVMASDERPVDHVKFTTDDGLHWREYNFGVELWVESLTTALTGDSRKFVLIGYHTHPMDWGSQRKAVAIYLNFSELTSKQCEINSGDPSKSDFELWDPSVDQEGKCLLGTQTSYYRRKRPSDCYIGDLNITIAPTQSSCKCTEADFECDYNHSRNSVGECVLIPGAPSLSSEQTECTDEDLWYERTAYRKIPKSGCVDGVRLDRGTAHYCRGHWFRVHRILILVSLIIVSLGIVVAALWYYRRKSRKGPIHLPDGDEPVNQTERRTLSSIMAPIIKSLGKFVNHAKNLAARPMALFGSRRANQGVALNDEGIENL